MDLVLEEVRRIHIHKEHFQKSTNGLLRKAVQIKHDPWWRPILPSHESITKEGAAAFRPPGCRLVKDTPHTFPRYEGVVISLTDDISPGRVALVALALSGLGTRSRRARHS